MGRESTPVLDPEFLEEVVQNLDFRDATAAVDAIEELVASWLYDVEHVMAQDHTPA